MSYTETEKDRRFSKSKELPVVWVEKTSFGVGFRNQRIGIAEKINPSFEIHDHSDIKDIENGSYKGEKPDIIIATLKPRQDVHSKISKYKESSKEIFYITSLDCGGDLVYGDSTKLNLPKNHVKGVGVPNAVTKEKLELGKKEWGDQFSGLPHPQITVLLGGDCSGFEFTPEKARKMARDVVAKAKELGGSLVVNTSNRTGAEAAEAFMDEIHKEKHVPAYLHDFRRDAAKGNPYFGVLGLADAIIVSGDSMSMCCEVNISNKPVYIYTPEGTRVQDAALHNKLYDKNLAKPFSDFVENGIKPWKYESLDYAGDIAKEALKRWREQQSPNFSP